MSTACCDKDKGLLLHGYELHLLSESESNIFETHLLECPYCFALVKEFAPAGIVLATDSKVKSLLEDSNKSRFSFGTKLRRIFWPDETPIIFKPAVLFVAIVVLAYPAYLGINNTDQGKVRPTQEIGLVLNRSSNANNIFFLDKNIETVLSFLNPFANNTELSIKLLFADSQKIYEKKSFTGIDSFGVGHLLIPQSLVKEGKYNLIVSSNDTTYQFYFTIKTGR